MTRHALLEPNRDQIEIFVEALFRHAGAGGFVSSRAFVEDSNKVFRITPVPLKGDLRFLIDVAEDDARRAANDPSRVVYCPPLATFSNKARAREVDVILGLALSVECDEHPQKARARLEEILGAATVVVRSGGTWINGKEAEDKLHLHWRLRAPARDGDLVKLKQARDLATRIVGGDPSNKPVCHPIRWPGSWHRKADPRLCEIEALNADVEINLGDALAALKAVTPEADKAATGNGQDRSDPLDWSIPIQGILAGENLHDSICKLAASFVAHGMSDKAATEKLRSLMTASKAEKDARWRARYDDIPRAVRSARKKFKQEAKDGGEAAQEAEAPATGVRLADFFAYMPGHTYIFAPSREMWPARSVNSRVPPVVGSDGKSIPASSWLDVNAAVEQMTWAPGEPSQIKDRLINDGGWIERPGCNIFNLYRPPIIVPRAGDVAPWLALVHKVFPNEANHIVLWLAHRVQRPHEKINHAVVLGGSPGIGKDTILEPAKQAVGPWNFGEASPKQVLGRFNRFLRSVILRINEARDLGEFDRYAFHDHLKVFTAAPPDTLPIDEKNLKEYYVPNVCGVVITSNHKTDGIYLPADDRRHFVAWSNLTSSAFAEGYWRRIYGWYRQGGIEHVAAYLAGLDLSDFDPKEPPPKTQAFFEIANANLAPEDAELADVLDDLERPDIVTVDLVVSRAISRQPAFAEWLRDRRNRRNIPHRFEACQYVAVSNPNDQGGRWKMGGVRHTLYGKSSLTERDRLAAALRFTGAR